MPDSIPNNWEPDPRKVGKNWQDMFRDPQRDGQPPGPSAPPPAVRDELPDDEDGALNLIEYKPWIVQRVRSRPALMLELRRYEPRSGFWQGWAMPYHGLYAVEYMGDRMLSLDFGARQFVIEGRGLNELAQLIQQGTVLRMIEHCPALWPGPTTGTIIMTIRRVQIKI